MELAEFKVWMIRWQVALTLLGIAGWLFAKGSIFALSFLCGALAAQISFWLLYRVVATAAKARSSTWMVVLATFRLLLIAGLISAIVKTYGLQVVAAASGVSIVIASIVLEVVRQKLHGT